MKIFPEKFTGKVFFGTGCSDILKNNIYGQLKIQPGDIKIKEQNDGELWVKYCENVRDHDIYIIQPTHMPYRNFMELLIMTDAARRSSAGRITLVIPYLLHARQERKDEPRVSVTVKLVAKMLSHSGADRVLLLDLHAPAIQGFFDEEIIAIDEVYASIEFVKFINQTGYNFKDVIFMAADLGGIKKARFFAEKFNAGLGVIDKRRPSHGVAESMSIIMEIGDTVQNKIVIFIEDMIDTGGTLVEASELVQKEGGACIYTFTTHPVLSAGAAARIQESPIERCFVTDSIPKRLTEFDKFEIISMGRLLGESIKLSNQKHKSLSGLFQ